MKVKDLIEKLQQYPDDTEVVIERAFTADCVVPTSDLQIYEYGYYMLDENNAYNIQKQGNAIIVS